MKKGKESLKGHLEGQKAKVQKNNDFPLLLGPFGTSNHVISAF